VDNVIVILDVLIHRLGAVISPDVDFVPGVALDVAEMPDPSLVPETVNVRLGRVAEAKRKTGNHSAENCASPRIHGFSIFLQSDKNSSG